MKILYYGGQRSGKSRLAEEEAESIKKDKTPVYIATYDNTYDDKEMQERIKYHQIRRGERFKTVCEPFRLSSVIKEGGVYLIDCLGMWLLNAMERKLSDKEILKEIEKVLKIDADIVFVLNEVGSGISPAERYSRRYIDLSGLTGQMVAKEADRVYHVVLGIKKRLK
jgi:adenosylcobinamide kinase/adenosylcobinamide-phosphate guanylyltransferase